MKAPSYARRLLGTAAVATGLHPGQARRRRDDHLADEEAAALFHEDWYRKAAELDGLGRAELLAHYRTVGVAQGLDPHPLFDVAHYRSQLELGEPCDDPVEHYVRIGAARGLDPHPLFATTWYLDHYEDVAEAGVNPLTHYVTHGGLEGRNPGPDFDGGWYLEEYPDVADAGLNPLVHFWLHGRQEGRLPTPGSLGALLVSTSSGTVNVGSAIGLESSDWIGPPHLLEPPAHPTGQLDPDALIDHKVVSFDVWDTLLMRRCHPEEIKLASARHLLLGFHRWIRPQLRSVEALYRARLAAEAKVSAGEDREYMFDQAAVAWVAHAMVNTVSPRVAAAATDSLVAHELAAEIRATYRNEAMDPVLRALSGRTLVFASDFYLSESTIRRLLTANGVAANFVRSWVSCETGEAKRSGRMFTRMLDELGTEAADLIHIGDNRDSDVVAAEAVGVAAVHHEVVRSPELEDAVARRIDGDRGAFEPWLGAATAAVPGSDDPMTVLGARFAPVMVGLALRIVEEAARNGCDAIYFFTREGQLLQCLVDRILDRDPYHLPRPRTELLEVSRRATFGPSLASLGTQELMRLWSMYSTQSPRALLDSLGLDVAAAAPIFARNDLDLDEAVTHPWDDARFRAAIADPELQDLAEAELGQQRDLLRTYLDERGLTDGNPLVVDLGWRGTIQDNLSHLLGRPLSGIYLGLYEFLNEQVPNSHKVGWLFDHNDPEFDSWTVAEVAPLEMVFNGPGGSVTSYRPASDAEGRDGEPSPSVVAERLVEPDEESVIVGPVAAFQAGALAALDPLMDVVELHALTSDDLHGLARKLVRGFTAKPPPAVAEAFFALAHNETFGTGAFQEMGQGVDLAAQVRELGRNELYSALARSSESSRWPEGLAALSRPLLTGGDGRRPLHLPTSIFAAAHDITTDASVGVFAPAPIVGSGGHRTIYNLARGLAATGLDVRLFLSSSNTGLEDVAAQLRGSGVGIEVGWNRATTFDYALATVASSASQVKAVAARNRGYLVQDFEASFNPVSDGYAEAETSYTDGLDFLTVGNWLGHVLQTRYGSPAFSSGLGAASDTYRVLDEDAERPPAICFLYQPEKPRRTPRLGIDTLRLVKQTLPQVEVHVYGSEADVDLDFEVKNHGLIRDLRELNRLYNRCRVGLCISMTNPSRIPFEMMAAGTVPVDVYRYNNLFDYADDTALLAYQSPASLAAAIIELLSDDDGWRRRQRRCQEFMAQRPLCWERDVMVNTVLARLSGVPIEPTSNCPTYRTDPVIAPADAGRSTRAFCDWQWRSAAL